MKYTLFALLPLAAYAPEMTGPTLGWSQSADGRSLQAIYGVPGAARLGQAVAWPDELTDILLSPSGQRAVAREGDATVLVDLLTRQRTPLRGATRAGTKVWSPLGTALLLANNGQVHVYVQRGSAFEPLEETSLPAESYAVSDDGSSILAIASDELVLHNAQGASVLGRKPAGFTFLAGTNTPALTAGAELVLGNSRFALPVDSPLLVSPAAGKILAIDRESGRVIWFDDQGTHLADATCNCAVERVERLGATGTLRLISSGSGPAWVAETSNVSHRLFFVPNASSNEVEQ